MQYTQSASRHEQAGFGGQPQRQVEAQLPRYQLTDAHGFQSGTRAVPTLASQEDSRRQALQALALGLMQQHRTQQQQQDGRSTAQAQPDSSRQLQGRAAHEQLVQTRAHSLGRAMPPPSQQPSAVGQSAAGGWRSAAAAGAADLGHLLPQANDDQRAYRRPTQHQDATWSDGSQPHHSEQQQQPTSDRFRALPPPLQRRADLPLPAGSRSGNGDGSSGRMSGGSGSAGGVEARGHVGPLVLSVPGAMQQRPRQPIDVQQLGLGYAAPQYQQQQQVHRQPLQLQQQPFSTLPPQPRDHARQPPAHQAPPPPAAAAVSAAAPPSSGSAGLLVPRSFLARYISDAVPGAVVPVLLTIDDGSHPSGAGGDDETGGVIACHQGDMLVQGDGSGILANAAIGAAVHPYMGGWQTVGWRLVGKVMGGLLAIEWQVRPAARFVGGGGTGGLVLAAKPPRQPPAPQREAPPPPQQQQQEPPLAERPASRGGASADAPPSSARAGSAAADNSSGPAASGVSAVLQALLGADGNADPQRLASHLAGSVNGNTAAALAAALLLLTKQGDGGQQQQQKSPRRDSGLLQADPEPARSPVQRQQLPPPSPRTGADGGDSGGGGGSLQQAIQLLMGARAASSAQQNTQQQQLVHQWKQEHPAGNAASAQLNRTAPPPSTRPGSSGSPRAPLTATQDDARPQRPAMAQAQLSQSSRGSVGAGADTDAEVARTAPRGMCRYMTAGELSLLLSDSEARLLQHPPCALLVRLRIFLDGAPLGPEQAAQICRYNVSSPRYLTSVPGQEATSPPIPWRLMEGATTQFRRCASGCLQLWAASPRLLPPGWKALVGDTPGITLPGGITTGGAPISAAAAAAMPPLQAVRPASAAGGNDVEMTEANAGGGGGSPVYPAAGLDGGVLDLGTVRTDRRTSAAAAAAAATAHPPPSPLRSVVPAGGRAPVGGGGREEAVGYSEEVLVACPPRSLSRYLTKSELELLVGPEVYKQLCEGNKLADVKVMFEVNGVRNKTVYLADVERYNASSPFYLKAASGRTQDGLPWRSIPQNATVQWRRMADNTLVLAQVPMPQRASAYATGGQAAAAAPDGAGDARPANVTASTNASGGGAGVSGGVGALEPRAVPPRARTRTDVGGGGGEADGGRRRRREQDSDEETEECDSDTVSYASGSEEDEHPSRQRNQPRQAWRKRPAPGGGLTSEGREQQQLQQQEGQLPGGQPLAKRHCASLDATGAGQRDDDVMYDGPYGRDEHGGQGEAAEYMRAVEAAEVLAATARGMRPPAPAALAPLRTQQQAASRNASLSLSGVHDNAPAAAATTKSGSPSNSYGTGASPSPPPPGGFGGAAIPTVLAPGLLRPMPGGALYAPLPGAVLPSTVATVATHTNTASSSDASPFISRVVATNLYIGRRQLQALYGPSFKAETTSDMLLALNGVLHTDVYRVTWKEGCHKGSFYPKGAPLGQLRGRFLQGIYWLDDTKSQLVAVAYDNAPPGWPVRRRTTANGAPPKPRRWLWQRQAEKAAKAGPGSGGDGAPPPQQEAQQRQQQPQQQQQQQQVLLSPALGTAVAPGGVTVWQVPVQVAAAPVAAGPYQQVLTTVPLGTLAPVNPTAAGQLAEPPAWQQEEKRPHKEEEQQREEAVPAAPSKAPSASQAAAAAALALFTSRVRQGGPGGPGDTKDAAHTSRPQSSQDSDGTEGRQQQQQHEQRDRYDRQLPAPREEQEVAGQGQGSKGDAGEKQGAAASSSPRMNVQQLLQLVQGMAQSKQGNGGTAATAEAAAAAGVGREPASSGDLAVALRVEPPSDAMEVDEAEGATPPPPTPPGGDIAAGASTADAGANGEGPGSPAQANRGPRVKVEPPQQLFATSGEDAAGAAQASPTVSECGCGCGDGSGSGKHKGGPGGSPHRRYHVSSADREGAEKEGESRKESESAVPQGLLNLMQAAAAAAAAEVGIAPMDSNRAGRQEGVRELHGE